jgi:flagellin
MIINHNISAIFAQRQLKQTHLQIDKNIQKLSSGLRITRAGDDASGLAVSEKMRTQIRGLRKAEMNAENGISFIQVAEGYMEETTSVLQRVRELAVQAANGIYSNADRMQINVEVSQLVQEIDRIAETAEFNQMKMLTGKFDPALGGTSVVFHVGANADQRMSATIGDMTAKGLNLTAQNLSISTADKANQSIANIDVALDAVSKQRADLGAYQNRMELTVQGLSIAAENMQAAESRIRDADIASEMVGYVKSQILVRSGTAMLAQANLKPQTVLELLR